MLSCGNTPKGAGLVSLFRHLTDVYKRQGKGGRPLEKTLPNPLLQNQRQVQLVRRILGGEGLKCSVEGFVYFTNPYVSVHVRGGEAYTSAEELCRAVQRPHSPGLTPGEAKKAVLLLQGRR